MLRNLDELNDGTGPGAAAGAMAQPSQIDRASAKLAATGGSSLDELAFRIAVTFRQHGHIGNVLTHICSRDWTKLEHAPRSILDPRTNGPELSPLAQNIVELPCANRGVTGPITRVHFHRMLEAILGQDAAARLVRQIYRVFVQIECTRRRSVVAVPAVKGSQQQELR